MSPVRPAWTLLLLLTIPFIAGAADGNRLAYLDEPCNPYSAGRDLPKLLTPQWVGEPGVEAVIVLSIDDLRDTAKYEAFLRPILQRLAEIDGRAAVSLMTNRTEPADPQLQKWLAEGASLEAHTWDHPCPLLQGGKLAVAKQTFDRSVDFMAGIVDNRPVGFRMPCCDSMSSVSPRFFTEIFNRTTPRGNFLSLDSSVFMLFTADDPELPRSLVLQADGRERFRKYVPTDRVMANLIEDYPYPYVIGRLGWEIPTLMPSDWNAQHLNGVCSPTTVDDLKAAVDAAVIKQGIFAICFHPHGWIRNDQLVEVIDHAVAKHGGKVKFLTFREVHDRLTENLLDGHPLRAGDGRDNGVRVLDLDGDGYMDVVIGNEKTRQTRLWSPRTRQWTSGDFPTALVAVDEQGKRSQAEVHFGVAGKSGLASMLAPGPPAGLKAFYRWHFDGKKWAKEAVALHISPPVTPPRQGDAGLRLRDLDGDGVCEMIVGNENGSRVSRWPAGEHPAEYLFFRLPKGTAIVDAQGRDAGLRLVDVDEDGRLDVVFSNADRYSIHLFTSITEGWSRKILSGKRGQKDAEGEISPIVRADGSNNGAWFSLRHMWVQNEDTGGKLPGHVFGRHFTQILGGDHEPPARSPAP